MQYPFSKQEKKIGNTNNKIEHIYDTHKKNEKRVNPSFFADEPLMTSTIRPLI